MPQSLQKSRWVLHSCASTASVTHISYLLKLYTSVDLMCQAIKPSVPSHPFPPLGLRQGPSIPVPGQSILADLCNATSEVLSPQLKEAISVLLCLGDHWLPSCLSVATILSPLGCSFLNSSLPSQFMDTGFQLRGVFTIPLPHVLSLLMKKQPQLLTRPVLGATLPSDWGRRGVISWAAPKIWGAGP